MHRRLTSALIVVLLLLIGLGTTFGALPNRVLLPQIGTPAVAQNPLHTGIITFYDATGAGACSFAPSPENMLVAAMNAQEWEGSRVCGSYVEVNGPLGSVVVRIVDQCPECLAGHLDLSREAFARVANPIDGRVAVTWRLVSPELAGPVAYHFKEGSNQWWTAVQLRNHRNPIARFAYQAAGGAWVEVPRVDYNYFVQASGMGPGPYNFRATDIYGNVLTDSGIVFIEGGSVNGAQQFPTGP